MKTGGTEGACERGSICRLQVWVWEKEVVAMRSPKKENRALALFLRVFP